MADAGFRLAVEGEKEFKKAIAEINAQIKANAAELKLLTAQYDANDKSMTALNDRQGVLEEGLAAQGQKVSALREQYEKMASAYGENDTKVLKLKTDLVNATAEYAEMSKQVKANQEAIDENWAAMENYREVTARVGDTLGGLDDIMADNRKAIEKLAKEYKTLGDSSKTAADRQENLIQQNERLADSAEAQQKKIDALNEQLDAAVRLYGENSAEVAEYKDAVNKANSELTQMEQQIKKNDTALENSEDAGDGLLETLEKISEVTGIEIPDGIKKMIGSDTAGGFLGAAVAAGGIGTALTKTLEKAIEMYKETLEWADELTSSAQEMNIDTEAYQALEYGATVLGVSTDVIQDAIKEINNRAGETDKIIKEQIGTLKNFGEATDEQKKSVYEAMKQWDELGVSIYNTTTGELRPANEILYDLIDAFGNITNSTERAYKMNDIFGESYRKLNPVISAGSETLRKLEEEARQVGYVMNEGLVAELDNTERAWNIFWKRMSAGYNNFLSSAKDTFSIKNAINTIPDLINSYIKAFGGSFRLPTFANGTYNHIGGYALVGEKGPEIVELPRGSRVYPNGQMPGTSVINNYHVAIDAKDVREFNDIVRIAQTEKQSIRMGYTRW